MIYTLSEKFGPFHIEVGYSELSKAWLARWVELDSLGQCKTQPYTVLGNYPTPEAAKQAARDCISASEGPRLCTPMDIVRVRKELAKKP